MQECGACDGFGVINRMNSLFAKLCGRCNGSGWVPLVLTLDERREIISKVTSELDADDSMGMLTEILGEYDILSPEGESDGA